MGPRGFCSLVKAMARPWAAVAWCCGFPPPILQCFWAAVCLTVSLSGTWGRGRICFVSRSIFARIRNYPLSGFLGKILSESSPVGTSGGPSAPGSTWTGAGGTHLLPLGIGGDSGALDGGQVKSSSARTKGFLFLGT